MVSDPPRIEQANRDTAAGTEEPVPAGSGRTLAEGATAGCRLRHIGRQLSPDSATDRPRENGSRSLASVPPRSTR
jgi:hypothetical protein